MAQLLRAHTALAEARKSAPNTHVSLLTAACHSIFRGPNIFFWPPKEPALKKRVYFKGFCSDRRGKGYTK